MPTFPPNSSSEPDHTSPDGRKRSNISLGVRGKIVQKQDQATGRTIEGVVMEIFTRSSFHPHGIKVRLHDGSIGRVKDFC